MKLARNTVRELQKSTSSFAYLPKPADADDILNALMATPGSKPARKIRCRPIACAGSMSSASMNSAATTFRKPRRLNMHRRTLQRILAETLAALTFSLRFAEELPAMFENGRGRKHPVRLRIVQSYRRELCGPPRSSRQEHLRAAGVGQTQSPERSSFRQLLSASRFGAGQKSSQIAQRD
jgi:hypothetical protein